MDTVYKTVAVATEPHRQNMEESFEEVFTAGLEPAYFVFKTNVLTISRSNSYNYHPFFVELVGNDPTTSTLSVWRSDHLSYSSIFVGLPRLELGLYFSSPSCKDGMFNHYTIDLSEHRVGFEPTWRFLSLTVLQTVASPLGHLCILLTEWDLNPRRTFVPSVSD